jgi:NADPH2:quinone reductase
VSFEAVNRFGHVVSRLGWGYHTLAGLSLKGATYSVGFTLLPLLTGEGRSHHGDILAQATRLVKADQLVPLTDPRRFSLGSVESAYNAHRDRDAQGKIVIDVAAVAHGQTFPEALART